MDTIALPIATQKVPGLLSQRIVIWLCESQTQLHPNLVEHVQRCVNGIWLHSNSQKICSHVTINYVEHENPKVANSLSDAITLTEVYPYKEHYFY